MKKTLLIALALTLGVFSSQAQSIGMVGTAIDGWPSDDNQTDRVMGTSDNVNFTYYSLVTDGGDMKFRQDFAWDTSWGLTDGFPSGTATSDNGGDIAVPAGIYDVTFNIETGDFAFTAPATTIGLVGPAAAGWPNDDNPQPDIELSSADGENYILTNITLTDGSAKFRLDYEWETDWGSSDFPTGTGTDGGADIPVTAGTYDIELNIVTGAYSFNQAVLSTTAFDQHIFSVFPNPTSTHWTIESKDGLMIHSVEVFNVLGKRVLTSTSGQVDAYGLTSGIYLARIEAEGAISSIKLIKR